MGAIKHLGRQLPTKCRKTLATGLILGKIMYMIQIWGGAPLIYISQLQATLNNTARYVLGKGRRTSTRHLMEEMGWLDINRNGIIFHTNKHVDTPQRKKFLGKWLKESLLMMNGGLKQNLPDSKPLPLVSDGEQLISGTNSILISEKNQIRLS